MSLTDISIREISDMLEKRKITAIEVLDEFLNIALVGSCITFRNDGSFEAVKKIDTKRILGESFPTLAGIPFSVKDNICVRNDLTSCNSRVLKSFKPDYSAKIIDIAVNNQCVLTSKNCMREFSIGRMEDCAFDMRNYLIWTGTSKHAHIGAFAIGTDLGQSESICGLWIFKPSLYTQNRFFSQKPVTSYTAAHLNNPLGIISGSPSLERYTLITRKADDLRFIFPFLCDLTSKALPPLKPEISINSRILIYNLFNSGEYLVKLFEKLGFSVETSDFRFLDKYEIIYDVIMCTEFYKTFEELGKPKESSTLEFMYGETYIENRVEGIGFEAKKKIISGAYLLSDKKAEETESILEYKNNMIVEMDKQLSKYDYIVTPLQHGDKISKLSAVAGYPELTVPYADVFPFKMITKPEREDSLFDMAVLFDDII